MAAEIIDGRAVAARVRAEVADAVAAWRERNGRVPGLATILVGDDPASAVYVAGKRKACAEVGLADMHRHLPADVEQAEVAELIAQLAEDPDVSGILLQLPVPRQLDSEALIDLIPPFKDVDGLTPLSVGLLTLGRPGLRPCTPNGVIALLHNHAIKIVGADVTVVGRSNLVGKPLATLLGNSGATVTSCHLDTRDLVASCRGADILVVAAGAPKLITPAHVKPGAVVIDVGITRTPEGLVGDVDFDAVAPIAGLITPVPGGVGPMTIAMLLRNTMTAAELLADSAPPPAR
jgi:methylenetetrahydrofolate dehydrogenase (NADP+) / methenyltetrahydrofolate cyclohydrolase